MNEKLFEAMLRILRPISRRRMQGIAQSGISTVFPAEYKTGHIAEMELRQPGFSAPEGRSYGDMQRVLSHIAHNGLAIVNATGVVTVAYAIWHHGHTPQLAPFLGLPFAADAAYLVDRLSRYNCVSTERKIQLLTMLSSIEPARRVPAKPLNDPLAEQWGASRDINEIIGASLPLPSKR